MKFSRYFDLSVRPRRPYLKVEWIQFVLEAPERTETQADGRIRHWRHIPELGKYLRVVVLEDGETIHNAFPDSGYVPKRS